MLNIRVEKTTAPKAKPAPGQKLGFGHIFTDHMFMMNYTEGQGLARCPHRSVPEYFAGSPHPWSFTMVRRCLRA